MSDDMTVRDLGVGGLILTCETCPALYHSETLPAKGSTAAVGRKCEEHGSYTSRVMIQKQSRVWLNVVSIF